MYSGSEILEDHNPEGVHGNVILKNSSGNDFSAFLTVTVDSAFSADVRKDYAGRVLSFAGRNDDRIPCDGAARYAGLCADHVYQSVHGLPVGQGSEHVDRTFSDVIALQNRAADYFAMARRNQGQIGFGIRLEKLVIDNSSPSVH